MGEEGTGEEKESKYSMEYMMQDLEVFITLHFFKLKMYIFINNNHNEYGINLFSLFCFRKIFSKELLVSSAADAAYKWSLIF